MVEKFFMAALAVVVIVVIVAWVGTGVCRTVRAAEAVRHDFVGMKG